MCSEHQHARDPSLHYNSYRGPAKFDLGKKYLAIRRPFMRNQRYQVECYVLDANFSRSRSHCLSEGSARRAIALLTR